MGDWAIIVSGRRMRRSCWSYMSSNCAQKDLLRFNKLSNCAQKDPLWFNKLLILLHSGRRPPLYFFRVFVRGEWCLIIDGSLRIPSRDGGAYYSGSPGRGGQRPRRAARSGGGARGRSCQRRARRPGGAASPWGLRTPGLGKPSLDTLLIKCPLICITRLEGDGWDEGEETSGIPVQVVAKYRE